MLETISPLFFVSLHYGTSVGTIGTRKMFSFGRDTYFSKPAARSRPPRPL